MSRTHLDDDGYLHDDAELFGDLEDLEPAEESPWLFAVTVVATICAAVYLVHSLLERSV